MNDVNPEIEDIPPAQRANGDFDDFNDIFGSMPASPLMMGAKKAECSDIPRIKERHETAGYRDGISQGKEINIQKGFDEGFGLGALLGLRAGQILGLLEALREGITGAIRQEKDKEIHRVGDLCQKAQHELSLQQIFAREWWTEEGLWRYNVTVTTGNHTADDTVTFADVAREHPVLKRWEVIAENEIRKWNLNRQIFGTNTSEVGAE